MNSLAYETKNKGRQQKPYYVIIAKPEHSNTIVLKVLVDSHTFNTIQNIIKAYALKKFIEE